MKKMKYIEVVFDIVYLIFTLFAAILLLSTATREATMFGVMTFILGFGDAFHLIPRILSIIKRGDYTVALGIGKMITSITMTVFYLVLYYFVRVVLEAGNGNLDIVIISLAAIRIIVTLMPQNKWKENEDNVKWGIIRNIPFTIMGLLIAYVFYMNNTISQLNNIPIAILLSFLFYIAVVLFAHKNKMIGILMLPKTMTYMWMIYMGILAFTKYL